MQCFLGLEEEIRSEIRSVYVKNIQSLERARDSVFPAIFQKFCGDQARTALESVYDDVILDGSFSFTKITAKVCLSKMEFVFLI